MTTPSDEVRALTERAAPRDAVGAYLARELDQPGWRECSVELIAGGRSNLTFLVSSSVGDAVLRRPPLSNRLPTAHDMSREHRVMTALGATDVPVPPTLALCLDEAVIGAPFYVMARVAGHIVRAELPAGYADSAGDRRSIGHALIDVLADLHAVDPCSVGLADYGRPDGYVERQIRRWTTQWHATRDGGASDPNGNAGGGEGGNGGQGAAGGDHTAGGGGDADDLDRLAARLSAAVPDQPSGPIVHGDYRLDNVLLDPVVPGRIAAVLDWELSTLGDPLADVGLFCVYWQDAADATSGGPALAPSATALPGFPTRAELMDRYAVRTGRDLTDLPWYVGFACFKLAVVLEGVVSRARAGAMIGDGFVELAARIDPLVAAGHAALSQAS